jgi:hypothetical protein
LPSSKAIYPAWLNALITLPRMFECAVYGYLEEIDALCGSLKSYRRTMCSKTEAVYTNKNKILYVSEEENGMFLTSREPPDKNKNRTAVCCRIERSRVLSPNTLGLFLDSFGYELSGKIRSEIIMFERNDVAIEVSKSDPPTALYLVKVYVMVENIADGEKMLSLAIHDLERQVHLVKPALAW